MKYELAITGKVYLCGTPCDMRLGLPGLAKKVRDDTKRDPKEPGLYVFVNKKFTRIKMFHWDRNGYAMFYKHVPEGVFQVERRKDYRVLTAIDLKALLSSTAERAELPPPAKATRLK